MRENGEIETKFHTILDESAATSDRFLCEQCPATFGKNHNLYRHMRTNHGVDMPKQRCSEKKLNREAARPFDFSRDMNESMFLCRTCSCAFQIASNRDRHEMAHNAPKNFACKYCFKLFGVYQNKLAHENTCSASGITPSKPNSSSIFGGGELDSDGDFAVCETALNRTVKCMRMNFHPSGENLFDRLQDALGHVHQQISNEQEQRNRQKVYLALSCDFYKPSMPDVMSQPPPVFNTEAVAVFPATDVVELVQKFYKSLITEIENYERCGSGWVLNSFQMLDIHFLHYNPLRASSFIPMPEKFHQKKA